MLWARGLHYAYGGSPALQGVSVRVREGEILSVTGPRGSGKTTLLSCLSGHLAPHHGEIWFDDVPVHSLRRSSRERLRRERFGWIGSEPHLVPELTAWENAALPLLMAGVGRRAAREAAHEWLERLDVAACARKRPAALLQSQRQRVSIARALAHSPAVVFADEPTAPLHEAERAQVLRTLTTAARSHGITMVLATHDPAVTSTVRTSAHVLVDRTLHLVDGRQDDADEAPGPGLGLGHGHGHGAHDDSVGAGDDGRASDEANHEDDTGPRAAHGQAPYPGDSGSDPAQDEDRDRDRGQDRNRDQGQGQGQGRNQDQDRDQSQGQSQDRDQGQNQKRSQGLGRDRGQGQNRSQGLGPGLAPDGIAGTSTDADTAADADSDREREGAAAPGHGPGQDQAPVTDGTGQYQAPVADGLTPDGEGHDGDEPAQGQDHGSPTAESAGTTETAGATGATGAARAAESPGTAGTTEGAGTAESPGTAGTTETAGTTGTTEGAGTAESPATAGTAEAAGTTGTAESAKGTEGTEGTEEPKGRASCSLSA
ncbi:hypothetical protein GCM10027091_03640 [Streptomyces daliensis]